MLRQLIVGMLLILVSPIGTQAQNGSATSTSWPITKRCLGDLPYPSLPREKWTFDGVIFSDNGIGVRAIRTDVPTSYYVALDGDKSFALDGSFSPDGKHFVYPTGTTEYATMTSNLVSVNALQIVSTDSHQIKLTVPWVDFGFSGVTRGIASPKWLDNNRLLGEEMPQVQSGHFIINTLTGEATQWHRKTVFTTLFGISPDMKRAFYYVPFGDIGYKLYDVEADQLITVLPERFQYFVWLSDSNGFIGSVSQVDNRNHLTISLTIFDPNGLPKDNILADVSDMISAVSISSDGKYLAFFMGSRLYVAELMSHTIIDLCFDTKTALNAVAWSPDNTSFVINVGGYPVIVNYENLDMQILRYEVNHIWGWYSLN